jgi:hypothetical protein
LKETFEVQMLQVLRLNSQGPIVTQWQQFLRGQGYYACVVSGIFDTTTQNATIEFQRAHGLDDDGVVGQFTYSKALKLGFGIVTDDDPDKSGPNWPPKGTLRVLTLAERKAAFGDFTFASAPVPGNPEAIQIHGSWVKDNIVRVTVPQLAPFVAGGTVSFHKSAADKLKALFAAWEAAGLLDRILTWDGGWAPRFVRGSRTTLSNHAWGTAFDLNAKWNYMGVRPALVGEKGSVRELAEIAMGQGWFWGGHYQGALGGRPDGMHFEVAIP